MAKYGSADCSFFLVSQFDLKGISSSLGSSVSAEVEETTGLGDAWQESQATGMRSGTLEAEGFYDHAADSVNAALSGSEATSRVISFGFAGNTRGQACTLMAGAFGGAYSRPVTRTALTKASATWTVSGQVDDAGVLLHPLGAQTATGTTTSVDNDASRASGAVANLHVTAVSGSSPTLDVKLRHSSDNSTFADVTAGAWTQATAVTSQRISVSGTVNRYVSVTYTVGGSSPSFTFAVAMARG